jgi:polysaccharide export outer membrane protein
MAPFKGLRRGIRHVTFEVMNHFSIETSFDRCSAHRPQNPVNEDPAEEIASRNRKASKTNQMLESSALKTYPAPGLLASIVALPLFAMLFFGCSSTPDIQTMQHSLGNNSSKLTAPSVPAGSTAPSVPAGSTAPSVPAGSESPGFASGLSDDELQQIQPPPGKYILGPGDVVTVTVWGHPELSGKRVIGPDGEIQLPFVGSFKVAGLNADDASRKLTSALREDYLNTAASVIVDSYNSNQIIVLGHVAHQGVLTFPGDPTLLEALAKAGAAPTKGDQDGMPTRCAIIRGRNRIMWVDLRPLMKGTDISLNMSLQRNDLLFVPDPDDELVYVMGQVKNPGPYPLTANMSFLEALSRAGGPNDSAQPGKIVLARPSKNTEEIVDLESDIQKSRPNYQLEAGDIVYVPKSGLAKLGYVLQQINPITTMVLFGAALM